MWHQGSYFSEYFSFPRPYHSTNAPYSQSSTYCSYRKDQKARNEKFNKQCSFVCGPGQLSRYSSSLRAGRSGNRIPVKARFSAPVQTGPGAHPASSTKGTGYFPGIKRPSGGADHPPPSSAEVKERVEQHLHSSSGPSWSLPSTLCSFVHRRTLDRKYLDLFRLHAVKQRGAGERGGRDAVHSSDPIKQEANKSENGMLRIGITHGKSGK
jgi:hypothetical protein